MRPGQRAPRSASLQVRIGSVVLAGGILVLQLGCAGLFGPDALVDLDLPFDLPWIDVIPLDNDLGEGGALAAAALSTRVVDARFPDDTARACDEHAARFTWLAARGDDPAVVEAALWAMVGCVDALHPPDARAVATERVLDPVPGVVGGAMALARHYVPEGPADDPLVQALVGVAIDHRDMGTRIEALEVLDERLWSVERSVSVAFFEALMADMLPSLTATALERLAYRGAGLTLADKPRFQAAAMVLASDIDPGIRGYAALALARLDPKNEDVRARVLGLLDDRHPYTRSAAADALADMAYLPAIHDLMARLDDPEPNGWRMLPYTRPDGERARMRFIGSHFERVDDAYLRAIERLTSTLEEPFVYREVNLRYKDLDIVAASRDARRWYADYGTYLPRRGIADSSTIGQADAHEKENE